MIHLVQDIYLDADQYQFMLKRKSVATTGKNIGSARFDIIGNHSNIEMVNKHLETLCVMELVNKDWTRMVKMVKEIKLNTKRALQV